MTFPLFAFDVAGAGALAPALGRSIAEKIMRDLRLVFNGEMVIDVPLFGVGNRCYCNKLEWFVIVNMSRETVKIVGATFADSR